MACVVVLVSAEVASLMKCIYFILFYLFVLPEGARGCKWITHGFTHLGNVCVVGLRDDTGGWGGGGNKGHGFGFSVWAKQGGRKTKASK